MGKVSTGVLLCLSVLMMFGVSSAETFLSVPNSVAEEENATIVVENSDVENFKVTLNVSGSEATYSDTFSASEGTALETIDLSLENLTQSKYSVDASVFNESVNFSDSSTSGFKVLSGITGAKMVDLTSKDISKSDCPLNKSKSMNDECKLFGVNVTVDESSNLSELSESGEPLTASLNGGQNYVGLVDTESPGEYDTVFWDDDSLFRELNETGADERSFVSPGEPVKNFRIGNQTAQLNTIISGENLMFSVPPTSGEVPFRQSDSISYAFLGYSEADQVLGSAIDVTPVEGIDMRAVSRNLGDQNTNTLQTSNSTTNKYGFTGIGNIQSANVGRHKVSINNVSSEYYEVKSFSISYRILDPSTGTRHKVYRPGETVKVEAVPTLNGEKINYDSIRIELTDSSGQRFKKTLDQSNSAIFNISEDISGGRASVSIKVQSGGVTQTESTSFEIKKFKYIQFH
jgi:MG2 domain.